MCSLAMHGDILTKGEVLMNYTHEECGCWMVDAIVLLIWRLEFQFPAITTVFKQLFSRSWSLLFCMGNTINASWWNLAWHMRWFSPINESSYCHTEFQLNFTMLRPYLQISGPKTPKICHLFALQRQFIVLFYVASSQFTLKVLCKFMIAFYNLDVYNNFGLYIICITAEKKWDYHKTLWASNKITDVCTSL